MEVTIGFRVQGSRELGKGLGILGFGRRVLKLVLRTSGRDWKPR